MVLRFSFDDGSKQDLKVAKLLEKYSFTGTFYIAPDYKRGDIEFMNRGDIKKLSEKHEIGGHTLTHLPLSGVKRTVGLKEIFAGKSYLEDLISRRIYRFAYPKGWYDKDAKKMVQDAGFIEARTMKRGVVDITGYDNYSLPITAHVYPHPEYQSKGIFYSITHLYNRAKEKGSKGYFHCVAHGWEIDKYDLWEDFEKILKNINADKNTKTD